MGWRKSAGMLICLLKTAVVAIQRITAAILCKTRSNCGCRREPHRTVGNVPSGPWRVGRTRATVAGRRVIAWRAHNEIRNLMHKCLEAEASVFKTHVIVCA